MSHSISCRVMNSVASSMHQRTRGEGGPAKLEGDIAQFECPDTDIQNTRKQVRLTKAGQEVLMGVSRSIILPCWDVRTGHRKMEGKTYTIINTIP